MVNLLNVRTLRKALWKLKEVVISVIFINIPIFLHVISQQIFFDVFIVLPSGKFYFFRPILEFHSLFIYFYLVFIVFISRLEEFKNLIP